MRMNHVWKLISLIMVGVAAYSGYTEYVESSNAIEANGGEVRFDDSVEKEQAQALADLLVDEEYFNGKESTVRLTQEEGVYQVQFVYREEFMDDPDVQTAFSHFARVISERLFDGARTVVYLADDQLENKREIQPASLGELSTFGNVKVYRGKSISPEQAQAVVEAIVAGEERPEMTFQMGSTGDTYFINMVANQEIVLADPGMVLAATLMARQASTEFFNGEPVVFHFTDGLFEPFLSAASTDALPAEESQTIPATE
jgi:hypothetical protein